MQFCCSPSLSAARASSFFISSTVDVFTVEFKEVVTIYFDVNVPFENKLDKMNPIFDVIAAKEMKFDENFAKAQQQFATENNFELIIPETVEEE